MGAIVRARPAGTIRSAIARPPWPRGPPTEEAPNIEIIIGEGVRHGEEEGWIVHRDQARGAWHRAFERGVVGLLFLFARETLAGRPVVTLTGFADGRMPTRRAMWSQSFPDEDVRDRFFEWMTQRVDRWEDWGAMAYRQGGDALTKHLLGLFAALMGESGPARGEE